ncbi:MAG: polysaccharide deacetylase family protein [Thermoplasmata archaeon]|nr:polysaccharide deacetylase family protein [Thermoplasmata archaeon]
MYFLLTADVESYSLFLNREDPATAQEVYDVGLPRVLKLLEQYNVHGTFYFTGNLAEQVPQAVELVQDHGHEIGCHGYSHEVTRGFDVLSMKAQAQDLQKAKKAIVTSTTGVNLEAFRAPALRINNDTVKVLEKAGFKTDSSVCSQRFDAFMSFGTKNKLKWLTAPRKPYYLAYDSYAKEGRSKILEVPVSAFIAPFIGTTMRITPKLTNLIQRYIFRETERTGKPIVFLYHPNECLDYPDTIETTKRAKGAIGYAVKDKFRQQLKLRNLGKESLRLLEKILKSAKARGFEFISMAEFRKVYKK